MAARHDDNGHAAGVQHTRRLEGFTVEAESHYPDQQRATKVKAGHSSIWIVKAYDRLLVVQIGAKDLLGVHRTQLGQQPRRRQRDQGITDQGKTDEKQSRGS